VSHSTPKRYFRISPDYAPERRIESKQAMQLPEGSEDKIRPGDGVVFAWWKSHARQGEVVAIGIITSVDKAAGTATLESVSVNRCLVPNPQGYRWWRQPHFKFADNVVSRYGLPMLFDQHFKDR